MVYCIKDIIKKYTKLSNSILQFLYTFILSFTTNQEIQQLEVNNITYNVPFEEKWLD